MTILPHHPMPGRSVGPGAVSESAGSEARPTAVELVRDAGGLPAALRSARVRGLHDYWQARRGGRALPARADIDPADITKLLPYIIITDLFDGPVRVRYRLAGTVVTDSFGFNIAGRWLHELEVAGGVERWTGLYGLVMRGKAPVFGITRGLLDDTEALHCEWGLFPLSSDGVTVDKCIEVEDWRTVRGLARYDDESLSWAVETFEQIV
jgi:PAS domain